MDDVMTLAENLARAVREGCAYKEYQQAKQALEGNDTSLALIREYRRLQMSIQMATVAGVSPEGDDVQRYSQISSLLFAGTETSRYLLAEMQLQRMMGEVFSVLTKAADLDFQLPGM